MTAQDSKSVRSVTMRRSILYGMLATSCVLAVGAALVMVVLHFSDRSSDVAFPWQVSDSGDAESSNLFHSWFLDLRQLFAPGETESRKAAPEDAAPEDVGPQEVGPQEVGSSVPSGKWIRQCGEEKGNCAAIWEIQDEKTGNRVLRVEVSRVPDVAGSLRMVLFAPLGIHVNQPISIRVDEGERIEAPILFCAVAGCFAQFTAVPVFVAQQMVRGTKMQFVAQIPTNNGGSNAVTITISLKEFAEVFQSL